MASATSSIFQWEKSYLIINENNELNSVSLNFFQRCFRAMGAYKDTHLARVAEAAQKACFQPRLNWSEETKDSVLQLIYKAQHLNKLDDAGYVSLDKVEDAAIKTTFEFKGKSSFSLQPGQSVVADTVQFKVLLIAPDGSTRSSFIEIQKRKDIQDRLFIPMIYENGLPPHNEFIINLSDTLAQQTYSFIDKLLTNSTQVEILEVPVGANRAGGAFQAFNYGFTGQVKDCLWIDEVDVGSPVGLQLNKLNAGQRDDQCKSKAPFSLDILMP